MAESLVRESEMRQCGGRLESLRSAKNVMMEGNGENPSEEERMK